MTGKAKRIVLLIVAGVVAVIAWTLVDALAGAPRFDEDLYQVGREAGTAPFAYAAYGRTLRRYVDDKGRVHYAGLKADREDLDGFVRAIGLLDPKVYETWPDKAKLAFWLNAYNALTLKLIVDHYPIRPSLLRGVKFPNNSIRQIPKQWDAKFFLAMGRKMSLNEVEHATIRETLRARQVEPRIHMALVCAAMGCPPLRNEPYVADRLDKQLDDQTRRFLARPERFKIDIPAGKVYLSAIFSWFGDDFVTQYRPAQGFGDRGQAVRASLHFVSKYLPEERAAYLRDRPYKVEFLRYDWTLNERREKIQPKELQPETKAAL